MSTRMVGLGQHRRGIVIAVGQDEYDEIDAADQVTPELITSLPTRGRSRQTLAQISQSTRQSVRQRQTVFSRMVGFCLSFLAFGLPRSIPSTRELRVHGQRGGRRPKRRHRGQDAKIS